MKKLMALVLAALLALSCACAPAFADEKLVIIATLFPEYDFARSIAGELADVELLLPPGVESHTYEPTMREMIEIHSADMFLYTGPEMEPWALRIADSLPDDGPLVVSASEGIELVAEEHEHEDEEEDEEEHEEHEEEHEAHEHELDPHIWLDLTLAARMTSNIEEALVALDPDNESVYRENAEALRAELIGLDAEFEKVVSEAARREMAFGGRFAFGYFTRRYDIEYICAYDSCSTETEPSVRAIVDIIEHIENDGLPAIYHEELVDPKVARSIAAETGVKLLLFHSAHNVAREELESGITFLDIMRANLESLREGLN